MPKRRPRVSVIAFDGISPFHLSVPCMVFGEEKDTRGLPRYDVQVCSESTGPLRTNAGFLINVQSSLSALRSADLVIVPSWSDTLAPASDELLSALRKAHARGATVVGLCLGAFVLAQSGLLDGRTATTHWMAATEFRLRYPAVHMRPEVLYVDEGDLVTSAGTAAGLDCCIHLLRQHFGAEAANRAARRMVVAAHRHGGQAQYIEQPVPEPDDDRFGALFDWIQSNLQTAHSLDSLAERVCMSRRNFTRRFKQLTGTSVQQWLSSQRLALAQGLLEDGDESVESIAQMAGFGSSVSMRQHFAATLNTSPTNYRRQFRKS